MVAEDDYDPERGVGPDGKCVMTGRQCNCIPKTLGHWCCWSGTEEERAAPRQSPASEKGKER